MRTSLHEDITEVEEILGEEADAVQRALRGALNALRRSDVELADEVIAFDSEVDALYVRAEQAIQSLLARQTPVASDLRLVLAFLHLNLHLERMADLCVTICKLTRLSNDLPRDDGVLDAIEEAGLRAEEMIRVARESFKDRDVVRARSLTDLDELIDRANRRLIQAVLALGHDEQLLEWGIRMMLVSRCVERIGDHAVDIGEQTSYLVTGEVEEFTDASRK